MGKRGPTVTKSVAGGILRDLELMARGESEFQNQAQIGKKWGVSQGTVSKINRAGGTARYERESKHPGRKTIPPPLRYDALCDEAKRAIDDFRYFRNRYFRRETPVFQQEVCDRITALEPEEVFLAFWPPGHGKTTTITHDYPVWRMLRARVYGHRFACLLISKSTNLGKAFLRRIKRTLEHNALLAQDFGWFKPEHPDLWTTEQLQVDGFDPELQGKEPTFIAAGAGSQIYGWRVDLIICDDLVDKESVRNPERQDQLKEWFHEEVESRVEKGGSLAMCGTRFAMLDLYGQLLKLRDDEGDEVYNFVTFPAHDSAKCPGPDGPHDAYPDGCLLWPEQKSYKWLVRQRAKMGTARFDFVYNQVESSTDENLFRKEWIEAAKDASRVMWDIPRGTKIVCTLDPSPTQYACAQAWAYDPDTGSRYLVAIERKRMTVGDMISLIANWTLLFRKSGKEPVWIFEQNAAQRWLFQSKDYRDLQHEIGVRVRPHTTGRNKADPDYGVQMLAALYEFNQISLPWGDPESRKALEFFISELLTYPAGQTNDGVMAQWFFEWNIRKSVRPPSQGFANPDWAPDFLKDTRNIVYLNRKDTA